MPVHEIEIDLAATGGRLPPGNASPEQVSALLSGKRPTAPEPQVPSQVPPKDATPPADPKAPPAVCRHCNQPADADPAEPTEADVYAFSQAVWRDERFTRTVPFFGEAAEVVFRTLTSDEEEAVRAAMERERAAGKLPDFYAILNRLAELRLTVAVAKLRVGGYIMDRPPPEDPYKYDLAIEFTLLRKGPLKNEAVYKVVGHQFAEFFRVADALERRALDKSFWQAADRAGYSPVSPRAATTG